MPEYVEKFDLKNLDGGKAMDYHCLPDWSKSFIGEKYNVRESYALNGFIICNCNTARELYLVRPDDPRKCVTNNTISNSRYVFEIAFLGARVDMLTAERGLAKVLKNKITSYKLMSLRPKIFQTSALQFK